MRRFRHQSCKAWAEASSPYLEQVTIVTSAILTYPHTSREGMTWKPQAT